MNPRTPMKTVVLLISTLLASSVVVSATSTVTAEMAVSGKGVVSLQRPSTWVATVGGPDFAPTLRFHPETGTGFSVLVTAIPRRTAEATSAAELESSVRRQGESLLPTAVQSQVEIGSISGAETRGFFYHLTDRNPGSGPGDYREMRQGAVEIGPILLSVTILTHTGDEESVRLALAMLEGARFSASKAVR